MKNDLPKSTVEFVSQLDLVVCDANKKTRNSPKIFNYNFLIKKLKNIPEINGKVNFFRLTDALTRAVHIKN